MAGTRVSCLARKTPRKALGALLLCAGLGHSQRQQELCLNMDYVSQGRGPGWELPFQGFGTGLLNSSLIPLMTTCLGRESSPLCASFCAQGDAQAAGGHRVLELAGWWEQAGHQHDPERQGTALGPCLGDASDKGW